MSARVVIIQERVLQYRRPFYELLRKRLARRDIELILVHSNPAPEHDIWHDATELPWAKRVPLRQIAVGGRYMLWQACREHVRGSDLVIVEQASRHLQNYLLVAEQLLGRRRLAWWGHGRNFDPRTSKVAAEWIKARLSRIAHWWFAYTELSADVVADTGFPRERITVVRNTVDTRELARAVERVSDADVSQLREELGLTGRQVALFLGALAGNKRLGYVCAAADELHRRNVDVEMVIAGAGPGEAQIRRWADDRSWARYVGPLFAGDKAKMLRLADVMMIPAWAGLVVLDAFAAELPLVTSASQPHPPEISYIHHEVNGLRIDDGGQPEMFGRAVADLLADPDRLAALAKGGRADGMRYTVEEMVERFATGIERALAD